MQFSRLLSYRWALPLVFAALFAGCSSDDGGNPVNPPATEVPPGVYIINEGNFNSGNATLSYYIPDSLKIIADVFETAAGKPLGDTGHSLTIHDGLLYIVVNNSSKIEVMDIKDQSHVRTIDLGAGASPRFIAFGPNKLGYISDLFANTVSVYDPAQNAVTMTIPVGDNPEQVYYSNNHIYVANSGFGNSKTLTVIEISTHTVVKTIAVGDGPLAFVRINAGKFALLCRGSDGDFNDPNDDTDGKIYFIQTSTQSVTDSIKIGGHPEHLVADNDGSLYTNALAAIQKINPATGAVTHNFISGNFYALGFDKGRNRLYATNAKDFQQPGELYVYTTAGTFLHKFTAGILPGRMAVVE